MHRGWHQVAFERELAGELVATEIGELRLLLVRTQNGVEAFEAACPHRGAHLAHGGRLDRGAIICPFHGRRIGLGEGSGCTYKVRGYPTLAVGGLIFVLLEERHDHGFGTLLAELDRTHFFVPGFSLTARIAPALVIENGFDRGHFRTVHGLEERPDLRLQPGANGELTVEGMFLSSTANRWQHDAAGADSTATRFFARVFSPNLCVTQLGEGKGEYMVLSAATPDGAGGCTIRVSLLVPANNGATPQASAVRSLLRDSKLAYEQDLAIWEHLVPGAPSSFAPDDDLVIEFHRFCRDFL
jgi:3-ketosteroid 9alpha-monooxygenase subunit A